MNALQAHYDGKSVCFDEPFNIQPNTPLVVVILENENDDDQQWYRLAMQSLSRAYDKDEPVYDNVPLLEPNPNYKP
ncbi:MAG: hypothetical protein HY738_22370 [Bacteroidia bacterium]|nr:hypothetical protein [Bacteroidia bacterium]